MKCSQSLLELNPESSALYPIAEDFLTEFSRSNNSLSTKVKRVAIGQLIFYLDDLTINNWSDVHIKDIKSYMSLRTVPMTLQKQKGAKLMPLSAQSLRTHLSAIRVFFNYLVDHKIISNNLMVSIKSPKMPMCLPKTIEASRLARIIEQVPNDSFEIRDKAIIELFYSSGLRLEELANLDIPDIDLDTQEVRVNKGKGDKDRVVPLGAKARDALILWLTVRAQLLKDSNPQMPVMAFFLNRHGQRISTRQISNRIKEFARKSETGINLHPHLLRHCMATHVLESSRDIRAVQELLGHANIATTEIYTHLDFEHLARNYDMSHPRAHKDKKNKSD